MDAILPFKIKNEQKFVESALKVGYNEMETLKFIYIVQQSDLDIFPVMHDERINILLYGWELCEDYKQKLNPNEWELPEELETVLKHLVPWSMDIWFSKEWDKCKYLLKSALIHCLNRARDLLMRMPDMMQINWDFLLLYNLRPWNVLYLNNLTVSKVKTLDNGAQSIETEELPPTDEDVSYAKLEQLPIIVLRLIKIFDQSSIDMVKTLCMRVITAWNTIHQTELETSGSRRPYIPPEDKRCLMLICHIYLMAVYESDDVKGYVIDNMINNIRFYYQGFQNSTPLYAMDNLEYTPARYIALTNFHLRVQKRDFFDFFIWNKYDTSLVNLFGVVSQAYKSYLLGNLLMELNNMNEDDFAANAPLYKRLMNSYVNEREKSELFLMNELNNIEGQRYAHNVIQTVKLATDFKSKICKGNRMSNIGNYENSDDTVTPLADIEDEIENKNSEIKESVVIKEETGGEEMEDGQESIRIKESELRVDPVFQYLPNNENMLYYVYDVLAKKDYKGWHFAKLVLLLKIIGLEQNMIETWRYHPGLTTDFMLNLEVKLSNHFVDLAKIFKDHLFVEQEFWLTAFYLNPTNELYEMIKRLGMRNNRKRTDEQNKLVMNMDKIEAKYALLSSTIDVKELATISNTDNPATDYDPLFSVLHSLRLPDSLVKDMLTAIFLPRNRSFAWAVDWVILRNRCKMIMSSSKEKKRFVDLNMAEANERLKYLIIDYDKYKNRPQLDYGTIEEGYENLMTSGEFDKESEDEEEEEEEDFEDDEDVYESKKRGRRRSSATTLKKEEEKTEDDNSQEDDPFLMGKRRTRARTAATLASFLFQTLPRTSRRKKTQIPAEEEIKTDEKKISDENDDKASGSKSLSESPIPSPATSSCGQNDIKIAEVPTKNLKECLKERPAFLNTTYGFQNLIDIWNVEKSDLQSIDENCVSLLESSTALQIAVKLKLLNREINPMGGCDEMEFIDDNEMLIHNAEYLIKRECDLNAINEEDTVMHVREIEERTNLEETSVTMDTDDNEPNESRLQQPEDLKQSSKLGEANFKVSCAEHLVQEVTACETSETDHNEEMQSGEGSNSESNNSMAVCKVTGGEADESNAELNSKCNILHIEDKIMQHEDVSEQCETAIQLKESSEMELLAVNEDQLNSLEIILQDISKYVSVELEQATNNDQSESDQKNKTEEKTAAELAVEETKAGKEIEETEAKKLEESRSDEKLTLVINNKLSDELEDADNEKQHEETESQQLENDNRISSEEQKDLVKETEEAQTQLLENIDATSNCSKILEQFKGADRDSENKESKDVSIHKELSESNEIDLDNCNEASECAPNINTEVKSTDIASQQLENQDVNETMLQILEEELQIMQHALAKDLNKPLKRSQEPAEILNEILEENSDEKLIGEESKSFDQEANNSKEVLTDENVCLQKVTDSEHSIDNESQTGLLKTKEIENTQIKKNNDGSATVTNTLENDADIKTVPDDFNRRNYLNENAIVDTSAHNHNKDKIESEASNSSDDKHSLTQTQNVDSATISHCSTTNVELNEISERIDQTGLQTDEGRKSTEAATDQEKLEANDCKNIADEIADEVKVGTIDGENLTDDLSEDTNEDSIETMKYQEDNSDCETQQLKNLCLTRSVKVLLRRLRPSDLTTLREPRVKVQRMNFEKHVIEPRAKRRHTENRVYLEFEDSSNSNNSFGTNTSSSDYRPTKVRKTLPPPRPSVPQVRTSESENDSTNSDDFKLSTIIANSRKRRLSTPSTSQSSNSQHVTGPKSARRTRRKPARYRTGPKSCKQNLIVTPRSASGLKLRISNAEQNQQEETNPVIYDEVIQLSSSSDEYPLNVLTVIEEVIEVEEYALFEEEIII